MPRRDRDYAEQVERLISEAILLPYGPTRVELCEEAIRLADSHGDTALAYDARQNLMDAACFGGRPDLLIVSFSWSLATWDRNEDLRISQHSLLWRMKWVLSALPKFPEIPLTTIQQMLDDMERRFREYGGSIQPVVTQRLNVALQTGDLEAARRLHKELVRLPRTALSNCPACEMNALVSYHFDMGQRALGVRKGEKLIQSGMTCATVPDSTYASILVPMLALGRGVEAVHYHKIGYALVRRKPMEPSDWGDHLAFLALTGNDARAVKVLERHMPQVESSHDPKQAMSFLRSALLAVECLAERRETLKLRLSPDSPLANATGRYDLAELAAKMRTRLVEQSQRYDQRNGNGYFVGLIDKTLAMRSKSMRIPIGP